MPKRNWKRPIFSTYCSHQYYSIDLANCLVLPAHALFEQISPLDICFLLRKVACKTQGQFFRDSVPMKQGRAHNVLLKAFDTVPRKNRELIRIVCTPLSAIPCQGKYTTRTLSRSTPSAPFLGIAKGCIPSAPICTRTVGLNVESVSLLCLIARSKSATARA